MRLRSLISGFGLVAEVFMNPYVKRLDILILFRYIFYNHGNGVKRLTGFLNGRKTETFFLNIAILFLIIFSGCATQGVVKDVTDEDALMARVTEFWNYRINLELDKGYYYEYPLMRKKISLVQYIRSFNIGMVRWKGFSIKNIKFTDEENAEVNLSLRVSVSLPAVKKFEHDANVTEKWAKVDGEWYHVSKRFL